MHVGNDKSGLDLHVGDRVRTPAGDGEIVRVRLHGVLSVRLDTAPAPGALVVHARPGDMEKLP